MSLRETRVESGLASGGRRPWSLPQPPQWSVWDGHHWSLTPEQSLDFPVERTRQVTVTEQPYPYCGAKQMICGVDVSSKSLDARIGRDGAAACFTNNPKGIAELAEFCQCHKVHLVAMEATGGYEKKPFALLWAAGIQVAVVNPRAVRNFAHGMGLLEKTDRIDAGVIAWYAQTKGCVAISPASAEQQQLKAMVTRLRQLTELRAAQRNQRLLVTDKMVLKSFRKLLDLVQKQIRDLEVAIAGLIDADAVWHKLDQSFRSIQGVADL